MKKVILVIIISVIGLPVLQGYAQNPQEILDSARASYEREEFEQAAGLYYRLAKEGHPEGMLEIAFMFRDGVGIEKNENKAIEYFEEAADKGLKYSFQPLAELYHKKGMVEEAAIFYKLAVKDFPENYKKLAIIYFDNEDYEEALPFVKKLVKNNDPDGVFLLGVMTYEGLGIESSEKNGLKHLKKAAEMGHPGAVNFLRDVALESTQDADTSDEYDTNLDDDY